MPGSRRGLEGWVVHVSFCMEREREEPSRQHGEQGCTDRQTSDSLTQLVPRGWLSPWKQSLVTGLDQETLGFTWVPRNFDQTFTGLFWTVQKPGAFQVQQVYRLCVNVKTQNTIGQGDNMAKIM